jgi:threonine/homoserine/homoserine lactone efflux protein
MPTMTHLLAFAGISLLVILIPGPSVLFTVGRALTVGQREALLTVAGNAIGAYMQVIAVALGAGVIVQASAFAFGAIKLAGAMYLVFLGIQAFRHRYQMSELLASGRVAGRPARVVVDGFVVGVTNPKTIVVFLAALPQVVDPAVGHAVTQMLVLGSVFPAIALVSDSVWAVLAGTARSWFARSPRRLAAIGGTGGLAMVSVGVALAITGRKD